MSESELGFCTRVCVLLAYPLESSPYFESFKVKDIEVLFLYDTRLDDFVFSNLAEFKGTFTISIDASSHC